MHGLSATEHAMTDENDGKTKKHPLTFKRKDDEKDAELYARGQQFVGAVQQRQRRYIALADVLAQLQNGKHVQNRTLDTHLTAAQYAAYEAAQAQQKLIRSGSKQKPHVIKYYETELNRVQLQDTKAKDLHKRGHADGAAAIEELCRTQLVDLRNKFNAAVMSDPTLQHWLDRPIPANDSTLSIAAMPRSITSSSKSSLIQRKSPAQIKLDAVQAAMRDLE
jgi:cell pole-organizing protein PopZ